MLLVRDFWRPAENQMSHLSAETVNFFARTWRRLFPWRYDERNPARRFCKECGQQQDLYGMNWEQGFQPTGWESMGYIRECSRDHGVRS